MSTKYFSKEELENYRDHQQLLNDAAGRINIRRGSRV